MAPCHLHKKIQQPLLIRYHSGHRACSSALWRVREGITDLHPWFGLFSQWWGDYVWCTQGSVLLSQGTPGPCSQPSHGGGLVAAVRRSPTLYYWGSTAVRSALCSPSPYRTGNTISKYPTCTFTCCTLSCHSSISPNLASSAPKGLNASTCFPGHFAGGKPTRLWISYRLFNLHLSKSIMKTPICGFTSGQSSLKHSLKSLPFRPNKVLKSHHCWGSDSLKLNVVVCKGFTLGGFLFNYVPKPTITNFAPKTP